MIAEIIIACGFISPDPFEMKDIKNPKLENFKYSRIEYFDQSYYSEELKLKLTKLTEFQYSKERIIESTIRTRYRDSTLLTTNFYLKNDVIVSSESNYINFDPIERYHIEKASRKQFYYYNDKGDSKSISKQLEVDGSNCSVIENIDRYKDEVFTSHKILINGAFETFRTEFKSPEISIVNLIETSEDDFSRSDTIYHQLVDDNNYINISKKGNSFRYGYDTIFNKTTMEIFTDDKELMDLLLNAKVPVYKKQYHTYKISYNEGNTKFSFNVVPQYKFDNGNSIFRKYEISSKSIKKYNEDEVLIEFEEYDSYKEKLQLSRKIIFTPRKENDLVNVEMDDDPSQFEFLNLQNTLQVNSLLDDENTQARIVSMEGKSWSYNISPGTNNIDISNLKTGAYLVQVMHDSKPEVYKFIR